MKIGYMGLPGSYTEAAARQLIKSQGLSDAELVPLISAAAVRRSLDTGAVSKGVIAVADQAGRPVSETAQVFPKDSYTPEAELTLPVHYCLFRRSTVADFDIREVASHPFALKQTEEFIALHYPYWADVDTPDTARQPGCFPTANFPLRLPSSAAKRPAKPTAWYASPPISKTSQTTP